MKAENFYLNTIRINQKLIVEQGFNLDLVDVAVYEAIKFLCENRVASLFSGSGSNEYILLYLREIQSLIPIIPSHQINISRIEKIASYGLLEIKKTERNSGTWYKLGDISTHTNITFRK